MYVYIWKHFYSVFPIYRGGVYHGIGYIAVKCWTTPYFGARGRDIFREIAVIPWTPLAGDNFFAKSAYRNTLCSCSQETIFREINFSLPVNADWNSCCAMVRDARQTIETSTAPQSVVQLIHCQCKSRLQIANLGTKKRVFNQIVTIRPCCLHPPFCPRIETVPQQVKSAWLMDISLAVYAHQNKAVFIVQNGLKYDH